MSNRKYIFEECVGKKTNYLTPESLSKNKKKWIFRCECGNLVESFPNRIYNGRQKSCGCKWQEIRINEYAKTIIARRENSTKKEIGNKYGLLTIVGYESIELNSQTKVVCKCECGKEVHVLLYSLKCGNTVSCGCKRDKIIKLSHEPIHGHSKTRLYKTWKSMIARCYNEKTKSYKHYGGRGIKVCDDWRDSPDKFILWAKENDGDLPNLTIDRIDVNGDYCPENCRFVTMKVQATNKRNTVKITVDGETKPLTVFCEEYNVSEKTVRSRIYAGWPEDLALKAPIHSNLKNLLRQRDSEL